MRFEERCFWRDVSGEVDVFVSSPAYLVWFYVAVGFLQQEEPGRGLVGVTESGFLVFASRSSYRKVRSGRFCVQLSWSLRCGFCVLASRLRRGGQDYCSRGEGYLLCRELVKRLCGGGILGLCFSRVNSVAALVRLGYWNLAILCPSSLTFLIVHNGLLCRMHGFGMYGRTVRVYFGVSFLRSALPPWSCDVRVEFLVIQPRVGCSARCTHS